MRTEIAADSYQCHPVEMGWHWALGPELEAVILEFFVVERPDQHSKYP